MTYKLPERLKRLDVIRVSIKRRGFGRKAVVTKVELASDSVGVEYRVVVGKDDPIISEQTGWTSLRRGVGVEHIGSWDGRLLSGSQGRILFNDAGDSPREGEGQMATRNTKRTAKSGSKKSGSTAAKSSSKKNGGTTRASNEELDKLAAQVVDLRDNKGKSWGEVEETLGVAPSRLRALYNRGGGQPKGARAGGGKKSTGSKSGGSKSGGAKASAKRSSRRKANPSAKA